MLTPEQTRIYYSISGEGPAIVLSNGIGVAASNFWSGICNALSKHFTVIRWDYRGHGRSDPPAHPENLDILTCAEDLNRLLEHLQIPKAVLVGHSMGVQVILEFYKHFPEKVVALIPILGTFEHPFNTFMRFEKSSEIFDIISSWSLDNMDWAAKFWPHLFHRFLSSRLALLIKLVHPSLFPKLLLEEYVDHMRRLDPRVFFHLARHMQAHSASDILEKIEVPCLIFAGEYDLFTPIELSMEMYQRIPNAEFQLIKHGTHAALVEQPDLFWMRMLLFFETHLPEYAVLHKENASSQSSQKEENASSQSSQKEKNASSEESATTETSSQKTSSSSEKPPRKNIGCLA